MYLETSYLRYVDIDKTAVPGHVNLSENRLRWDPQKPDNTVWEAVP